MREGLAKLVDQEPDLCVCGEAEEAAAAYAAIMREKPDAVILDLSLRGGSGLELIKRLQDLAGRPSILVVSMHDESAYADRVIRAGAQGYVMKRETSGRIVEGLRKILEGSFSSAMRSRHRPRHGCTPAGPEPKARSSRT